MLLKLAAPLDKYVQVKSNNQAATMKSMEANLSSQQTHRASASLLKSLYSLTSHNSQSALQQLYCTVRLPINHQHISRIPLFITKLTESIQSPASKHTAPVAFGAVDPAGDLGAEDALEGVMEPTGVAAAPAAPQVPRRAVAGLLHCPPPWVEF